MQPITGSMWERRLTKNRLVVITGVIVIARNNGQRPYHEHEKCPRDRRSLRYDRIERLLPHAERVAESMWEFPDNFHPPAPEPEIAPEPQEGQ